MRILVVGINYSPEHAGIAPYTTEAAEHWASRGHDVRVLTGVDHYPHWTVPNGMRWKLRERSQRDAVDVIRLRHYVPPRQTAVRRSLYEATFGIHVLVQSRWEPDVVVAVIPSLAGAAAAAMIARRARAPLAVWVQDLMGQAASQSGISGGSAVARAATGLEQRVLRRAKVVATVSEGFLPHVMAAGVPESRVMALPNWTHIEPPSADRDQVRRRLGWDDGRIVAVHSGNMGLKQDLENVIEAGRIAAADGGRSVRFVLMGDGSQRGRLASLALAVPTVELMPPAADEDFADVLAAADVLLIHERPGVCDMSLPSKLTSYLCAGRPVIAAANPDGATAREVTRTGAGVVVPPGAPAALLEAVRATASDAALRRRLAQAARRHAEQELGAAAARCRLDGLLERLAEPAGPRLDAIAHHAR